MKRIIMVVMALAMVVAFVPMAEAGDSAQLGLTVTFAPNEPVTIRTAPEGPFKIEAGKELVFTVIADNATDLKCESELPLGATFTVVYLSAQTFPPSHLAQGTFTWTPLQPVYSGSDALIKPLELIFVASNSSNESARMVVEITVIGPERVISIELNESSWKLDGVKLGEKRSNLDMTTGIPIHEVKNTGNINVMVDIGYAPGMIYLEWAPRPGLAQGPNTFITATNTGVIPPGGRIAVGDVSPGKGCSLMLTYGAPTSLASVETEPTTNGMSTAYEIRAFAAVGPIPIPIVYNAAQ